MTFQEFITQFVSDRIDEVEKKFDDLMCKKGRPFLTKGETVEVIYNLMFWAAPGKHQEKVERKDIEKWLRGEDCKEWFHFKEVNVLTNSDKRIKKVEVRMPKNLRRCWSGLDDDEADKFRSRFQEGEMREDFKRILREGYPAEVACRGSATTKDGKKASFKAQWEGHSYNEGAVLIVKVRGFKPNRYRIDTYAAQSPSEIKRMIGNMDTSDSDQWESTQDEGSLDGKEYYLLRGLRKSDGIQVIAYPAGTGTSKMTQRTKGRLVDEVPLSKEDAYNIRKEMNKANRLKEAWGEVPYSGRRSGNEGKTISDLFGECYKEAEIPSQGPAPTLYGEIVRAVNRIAYRAWNDGDFFCCGYGIETCGNAAQFLIDKCLPGNEKIAELIQQMEDLIGHYGRVDMIPKDKEEQYDDLVEELMLAVVDMDDEVKAELKDEPGVDHQMRKYCDQAVEYYGDPYADEREDEDEEYWDDDEDEDLDDEDFDEDD